MFCEILNTLSDAFPTHLERFYHSIQIQDEAFFYVEILQWGLPSLDASSSENIRLRNIISLQNTFLYDITQLYN